MTVYANLVNGQILGVYDLLPKKWNDIEEFDTKAKEDENFMRENGFVKIIRDTTEYDPTIYRMSDFPWYTVEDGQVIEHRDIYEYQAPTETPPEEQPPTE